jgi:hypothetical protein
MIGYKWQHLPSGTIPANTIHKMGTVLCNGNSNHAQIKAQGFMCNPRDWKNVEQKIYFDAETGSNVLILHMGGLGSESCPCCGFAYEAVFNSEGLVEIRKNIYYGNNAVIISSNIGPLPTGMKGVAFCRYNVYGNSAVRLEAWVDRGTHGQWKRVLFAVDDGFSFGKHGSKCGGMDKEAGTWGFPIVAFMSSFSYNYEKMTAREINAAGSFNEAGIMGGLARPTGGGGSTPLPATADT